MLDLRFGEPATTGKRIHCHAFQAHIRYRISLGSRNESRQDKQRILQLRDNSLIGTIHQA